MRSAASMLSLSNLSTFVNFSHSLVSCHLVLPVTDTTNDIKYYMIKNKKTFVMIYTKNAEFRVAYFYI